MTDGFLEIRAELSGMKGWGRVGKLCWTVFGSIFLFVASGQGSVAAERPNIVWIVSEDHSPLVGAYGFGQVQTPHLDRMAEEGVVFDNAFATSPVCAPARFSLITGRHASAHPGAEGMRGWHDLEEPYLFFPQFLREHGYYTANWGKTDYNTGRYLGGDKDLALEAAWNDTAFIWDELRDDAPERGPHWRNRPDPEMPFFQMFNIVTTHMSRLFPEERPENPRHQPADVILPPYHPDTPEVRRDWAHFLDRLEEMDEQVGGIFEDLREDGVLDNTIVFWFSDHGGGLMRSKRFLFDSGTRVPMIVWFGKNYRHLAPETVDGRYAPLVSFVDFAPTVLNLLELPIPDWMHGQPFLGDNLPASRDDVFLHRERMDWHIDLSRAVHDGRYLYIRNYLPRRPLGPPSPFQMRIPSVAQWGEQFGKNELPAHQRAGLAPKPFEQLFDTRFDPHNLSNVAENPAYAQVRARMRQALDRQLEATEDKGLYWNFDHDEVTLQDVREAASTAATAAGPDSISRLRTLLESEHAVLRFWGANGAAELGAEGKALEKELRDLLSDPEPVIRVIAAEALASQGMVELAVPVFGEALKQTGETVAYKPSPALWALNIIIALETSQFRELFPEIEPLREGKSLESTAAGIIISFGPPAD